MGLESELKGGSFRELCKEAFGKIQTYYERPWAMPLFLFRQDQHLRAATSDMRWPGKVLSPLFESETT